MYKKEVLVEFSGASQVAAPAGTAVDVVVWDELPPYTKLMVSPILAVKLLGEKVKPDVVTLICFAAALNNNPNRRRLVRKQYFFIEKVLEF